MRDIGKKAKWMKENRWRYENKAEKKRRTEEKYELIKELLTVFKSQPCVDCGKRYPHYVMDFDHVRGTKRMNVSKIRLYAGVKSLFEEIDKCDLVCANCHRVREWNKSHPSIESHDTVRRQ